MLFSAEPSLQVRHSANFVSDPYIQSIMRFYFAIVALAASALAHPEPVQAETETTELTGNTFFLVNIVSSPPILP
jgi:hypothetical protein